MTPPDDVEGASTGVLDRSDTIAPAQSTVFYQVLHAAEQQGVDRAAMSMLLRLLNAHPRLLGYRQCMQNMLSLLSTSQFVEGLQDWAGTWTDDIAVWIDTARPLKKQNCFRERSSSQPLGSASGWALSPRARCDERSCQVRKRRAWATASRALLCCRPTALVSSLAVNLMRSVIRRLCSPGSTALSAFPVRDPFRDDIDHELRGVRTAKADRRAFVLWDESRPDVD